MDAKLLPFDLVLHLLGEDLLDGGGDYLAPVGIHVFIAGDGKLVRSADRGGRQFVAIVDVAKKQGERKNHAVKYTCFGKDCIPSRSERPPLRARRRCGPGARPYGARRR